METKNTNSTPASTPATTPVIPFDKATMAVTAPQLIKLNGGTNYPVKDGITILDASFIDLRDFNNPKIVELVTLTPDKTFCVKIPERYAASGNTLLLSYEGAVNLVKMFALPKPQIVSLSDELKRRAKEDAEDQAWMDKLEPHIGKYDDSQPFSPWANKKAILAKNIAEIVPFNGTIPAADMEKFEANRKEFEPAFNAYVDGLDPIDGYTMFKDRFDEFKDQWISQKKWVPQLSMLNILAREFGRDNWRFLFVHSSHYALALELHNKLGIRFTRRLDGYRFWLWTQYEERLVKKEAALLESFGSKEVVSTNLGYLLEAAPVVEKGDRRRKHFEDRKQPRTGRNGKRWSGKGGHGFEIKDSDDN